MVSIRSCVRPTAAGRVLDRAPDLFRQRQAVGRPGGCQLALLVARDDHRGVGGDRRRRLDPGDIVVDVAAEAVLGPEPGGVEIDREHAVMHPALAGPGDAGAAEAAGQQVAGERQARALVLAEGAHGPLALARVGVAAGLVRPIEHARVVGQLAGLAHQGTHRHGRPALARHQHLAFGHKRGGEVEHEGLAIGGRHADRDRVGGEAPLAAAERGHEQRAEDVDEVQGDQPGLDRHLGEVADPAQMPGIAQGDDRDPVLARLADADLGRLGAHGLAHAVMPVEDGDGAGVDHRLDMLPGQDPALGQPLHVALGADHPVAVMAGEVRPREIMRDPPRLVRRASRPLEHGPQEPPQRLDLNDRHLPPSSARLLPDAGVRGS